MAEHDALASLNTCQADPALAQNDATASLQLSEDTAINNTTHATASSQNNAPYLHTERKCCSYSHRLSQCYA
jgi:hypothetical protein